MYEKKWNTNWGMSLRRFNLPLSTLTENYQQLDKNQPYYLICQMGSRSAQACAFLSQQGYQVTNVLGGTSGWLGQLEQ